MPPRLTLDGLYQRLLAHHGHQGWWPAESPFEVIVGAILTQNTAWTNVERAIDQLRQSGLLRPRAIHEASPELLAAQIRPAGYFNLKARRLKAITAFLIERYNGEVAQMAQQPTRSLRSELLEVHGVGPETADSILLYALNKRSFVVDAYTRRICARLGLISPDLSYGELQQLFEAQIPRDIGLYNDYHAQFVALGHETCRPRPRCEFCPLVSDCAMANASKAKDLA